MYPYTACMVITSVTRMPATTYVSNHTRFEIAVPFRVCSKPLPHEELRKILEDPPE